MNTVLANSGKPQSLGGGHLLPDDFDVFFGLASATVTEPIARRRGSLGAICMAARPTLLRGVLPPGERSVSGWTGELRRTGSDGTGFSVSTLAPTAVKHNRNAGAIALLDSWLDDEPEDQEETLTLLMRGLDRGRSEFRNLF